jgi:alcohol dehydrogenase, propanol-preferring
VFELHASGRTTVIRETRPLSAINESIADVLGGRVTARIVLDTSAAPDATTAQPQREEVLAAL